MVETGFGYSFCMFRESIQISGSGSGRIVRLISGTIRFRPDFKNCYSVHPYTEVAKEVGWEINRTGCFVLLLLKCTFGCML